MSEDRVRPRELQGDHSFEPSLPKAQERSSISPRFRRDFSDDHVEKVPPVACTGNPARVPHLEARYRS